MSLGHLNKIGWKNVEMKFEELYGRKSTCNSRIDGIVLKEVIRFLLS
jgi:hypothetical protein